MQVSHLDDVHPNDMHSDDPASAIQNQGRPTNSINLW